MMDSINSDEVIENYDPALGLEVHVGLSTKSKMFCGCPTEFGMELNIQTCPVCPGLSGVLPVANVKTVEFVIRTGLTLGCRIAPRDRFARRNYFYPGMIKNFQTPQYDESIVFDG